MPQLGAILTPVVTPFDETLRVDQGAYVRLLHPLVQHWSEVVAVQQAIGAHLARGAGLVLCAGTDNALCDVLERGGSGGVLVASHIVAERMHRMGAEPEHRREIDAELADVYDAMSVTTNPI